MKKKDEKLIFFLKGKNLSSTDLNLKWLTSDKDLEPILTPYIKLIQFAYYNNQTPLEVMKEAVRYGYINKETYDYYIEEFYQLTFLTPFRDAKYKESDVVKFIVKTLLEFINYVERLFNFSSRFTVSKYTTENEIVIEYEFFDEDTYNQGCKHKQLDNLVDELIIKGMRNTTSKNVRDGIYYPPTRKVILRIKYKDKVKECICHLEPKYEPLLKRAVKKRTEKDELLQEAKIGLFNGSMKWEKGKGAVANWLKKSVTWHLGNSFDELSTEKLGKERLEREKHELKEAFNPKFFKKRILKEKLESSGGRIDDPETIESETLSPEESYEIDEENKILLEIYRVEPKMKAIIEKEKSGKPLSNTERSIKQRVIKKYRKK